MDGGDLPVADTGRLVQHFPDRREAVGGTGGRGEQAITRGLIEPIVDADDDVKRARFFDRGCNDHPFDAAVEISLELLGLQELTGALQHDIAAEIAPRDAVGCRCAGETNAPIADMNGPIVLGREQLAPAAVDAIEFQEMHRGSCAAFDLVDVDDVEPVIGTRVVRRPVEATHRSAQSKTADTAHAVNANAHGSAHSCRCRNVATANLVEACLDRHSVQ